MTAAVGGRYVDPTEHKPSQGHHGGLCEFCGDLATNPTRCPGWLLHRTRQVYRVEGWDADTWNMISSTRPTVAEAEERMTALKRRFPDQPMRIVAETTAYMVVGTAPGVPDPTNERDRMT